MSGSMKRVWDATIEGANTYIRDLQEDEGADTTRFTLAVFNTARYDQWELDVPIHDVDLLDKGRYVPNSGTPLHDAIATTIENLAERLAEEGREKEKCLVVVMTDGFENASRRFPSTEEGRRALAEMVEEYEQSGNWTFVYLGANDYDVKNTSANLGFAGGNTMSYTTSADSTGMAYRNLSAGTLTRKYAPEGASASFLADAGVSDDVRDENDPTKS